MTLWLLCASLFEMTFQSNLRASLTKVDHEETIDSDLELLQAGKKLYFAWNSAQVSRFLNFWTDVILEDNWTPTQFVVKKWMPDYWKDLFCCAANFFCRFEHNPTEKVCWRLFKKQLKQVLHQETIHLALHIINTRLLSLLSRHWTTGGCWAGWQ